MLNYSNRGETESGAKKKTSIKNKVSVNNSLVQLQKKSNCACGGECPRCQASTQIQMKLSVGSTSDPAERQANQIAENINQSARVNEVEPVQSSLQRQSSDQRSVSNVPPVVHDVLQKPGKSLDEATRSFMEPRLGQDLSEVRIHADDQAAKSSQAVNAQAYTVGNHIAFDQGQYAPHTESGKKLLAHELAHVVQQGGSQAKSVQRKAWIGKQPLTVGEGYKKIVRDTWGEKAVTRLMELHTDTAEHRFSNWGELIAEYERAQKAPAATLVPIPGGADDPAQQVCESLPGFGQRGGSCAAASLITPVLIWDNEQYNKDDPNPRLRSIVSKMKTYMQEHKITLEPRFNSKSKTLYRSSIELLDDIATRSSSDGFKLTESEYQSMGLMLMFMSQDKMSSGLNSSEMQKARQTLGFPKETVQVFVFDSFFSPGGELAKMKPGQMAQITWFVKDEKNQPTDPLAPKPKLPTHAFTIGRMEDGTWMLNDQGYKKPLCLTGPDLVSLKDAMMEASDEGRWEGVTDDKFHEADAGVQTGYTILGDEKTITP